MSVVLFKMVFAIKGLFCFLKFWKLVALALCFNVSANGEDLIISSAVMVSVLTDSTRPPEGVGRDAGSIVLMAAISSSLNLPCLALLFAQPTVQSKRAMLRKRQLNEIVLVLFIFISIIRSKTLMKTEKANWELFQAPNYTLLGWPMRYFFIKGTLEQEIKKTK